jgi:hypothetical protein
VVRYRDAAGQVREGLLERVAVEDLLGGGPVRQFRWFKGRRFYSGWYWSATTGGLVAYESRLELARILLADFDSEVTAIAAQPFLLSGFDGGRLRNHVPDLLLRSVSGLVTVVDVKPAHRLDDPEVQAVFGWTERTIAVRGWDFEVWSGAKAVLLENVRFLAGYRRPYTVDTTTSPPNSACAAKPSAATGATTQSAATPPDPAVTSSPTCTTPTCHATSAEPSKDNEAAGSASTGSSR